MSAARFRARPTASKTPRRIRTISRRRPTRSGICSGGRRRARERRSERAPAVRRVELHVELLAREINDVERHSRALTRPAFVVAVEIALFGARHVDLGLQMSELEGDRLAEGPL